MRILIPVVAIAVLILGFIIGMTIANKLLTLLQ